jgi:hypothetical protein
MGSLSFSLIKLLKSDLVVKVPVGGEKWVGELYGT